MYNQKDKKVNFTIKMAMTDARKLLTYFNDEFMDSYDEFLSTLEKRKDNNEDENGDFEYYEELRNILDDLVYEFKKELRKKERTDSKNRDEDEVEKEGIKEKLNPYSLEILKKIELCDPDLYTPLLYKLYWYLHSSFDKSGELIFSQNSLEELLEMDKDSLEKFLNEVKELEISIGNRKGRFIESFKFLNSSTIKVNYSLYILNPHTALVRDKEFKLGTLEEISVVKKKK